MTRFYYDELVQCPECGEKVRARTMHPIPEPLPHDSGWLMIAVGAVSGVIVSALVFALAAWVYCP